MLIFVLYFDNATATKPSRQVLTLIEENLDVFASIASPYLLGVQAKKIVAESYEKVFSLFQLPKKSKVVFTAGGAEAVSQVVFSVWNESARKSGKTHFIASALSEAPAVLAMSFYDSQGGKVHITKASEKGIVTADDVIRVLSPRTVLLSLSLVSGLTGVVQPLSEIRSICQDRGVLLHVDITHAIGKTYLDLQEIDADYVTLSFNQLQGPVGSGLLIAKESAPLVPLVFGQNEELLRGGEVNIASMVSSLYALEAALLDGILYATEVARLKSLFEESVLSAVPNASVLFQEQERAPHITCMTFPEVKNEALLYLIQKKGLYASIGGSLFQTLSVALEACGIGHKASNEALSFAISKETTEDDIKKAVSILTNAVGELRRLSKVFV